MKIFFLANNSWIREQTFMFSNSCEESCSFTPNCKEALKMQSLQFPQWKSNSEILTLHFTDLKTSTGEGVSANISFKSGKWVTSFPLK